MLSRKLSLSPCCGKSVIYLAKDVKMIHDCGSREDVYSNKAFNVMELAVLIFSMVSVLEAKVKYLRFEFSQACYLRCDREQKFVANCPQR